MNFYKTGYMLEGDVIQHLKCPLRPDTAWLRRHRKNCRRPASPEPAVGDHILSNIVHALPDEGLQFVLATPCEQGLAPLCIVQFLEQQRQEIQMIVLILWS